MDTPKIAAYCLFNMQSANMLGRDIETEDELKEYLASIKDHDVRLFEDVLVMALDKNGRTLWSAGAPEILDEVYVTNKSDYPKGNK